MTRHRSQPEPRPRRDLGPSSAIKRPGSYNLAYGGMAERTNALVLKTSGGKTPVGSNPTSPAHRRHPRDRPPSLILNLLKIVKIMKTFTF